MTVFFLASNQRTRRDKNDVRAATKAFRRRLFETLTRGILCESPQGWVHGVFEKPPAKRLGLTLRSAPVFSSFQQHYCVVCRATCGDPGALIKYSGQQCAFAGMTRR